MSILKENMGKSTAVGEASLCGEIQLKCPIPQSQICVVP